MSDGSPQQLLQQIYDQELGFLLGNTSIKPVHVANGLGRSLVGRTYETSALARGLRRWVRKQTLGVDEERNPNNRILEDFPTAFEGTKGSQPSDQRLSRLRVLSLDVIGADGAVFEQPDKSSYTFSNERFLTRDPSDDRSGLFLSRLLTTDTSDGADAADYLRELLQVETDAITTLALPLLQFAKPREETFTAETTQRIHLSDHLFATTDSELSSSTLEVLRRAYDRLARSERRNGSKLNSLRRLMLFGCLVLHVHAISRWSERELENPRPPMLLDLSDGAVASVTDASRATLSAAGRSLEGLIRAAMEEMVVVHYGSSADQIRNALAELEPTTDIETIRATFETRLAMAEPVDALTRTLVEYALGKEREHPIGHLIELGRRAGYLTPWSNSGRGGKLQKRYSATAEFLETLIAATVEPDYPVEFPEFLDQLRSIFGIVVGRPEDDDVIRRNNIFESQFGPTTSINEEDLRENVQRFRQLVLESGYGKSYADGRTIVTTEPEGRL